MTIQNYAPIHLHMQYSLDAVGTVKQYVKFAKDKGLYGLGVSEHGFMGGALELISEGKKNDLKVVVGEEFYLKNPYDDKRYNHLTIWCKNNIGYKNICRLSSMAFNSENFYYKPRITYEMLWKYKEGLIIGSGCFIGPVGQLVIMDKMDEAIELAKRFKHEFEDDFYMEIMPAVVMNSQKEKDRYGTVNYADSENLQMVQNRKMIELAKSLDIKHICSSDAHMPDLSMEAIQKVKMQYKSRDWEFDYAYFMRSPEEFRKQWIEEFPVAEEIYIAGCKNTCEIVDKCRDVNLSFSPKLPKIGGRHKNTKRTSKQLIVDLIKFHNKIDLENQEYVIRLKNEIAVLSSGELDLLNYFILLEDVCQFCNENNIMIGPGRGSAAGSLLVYALNITDVDPIKFKLSFERFINKARISKGTLPDIDLDVERAHRDKVLRYIHDSYGYENVAQFGTIGTMKFKLALRDAIRILDKDAGQDYINKLAASMPWVESEKNDDIEQIKAAIKSSPLLESYFNRRPDVMKAAIGSIGQMRQYGVHAAAIAISPDPICDFVPLARNSKESYFFTQYSMDYCAKAGLIKYDLLGLRTLSDIRVCLELVKEHRGKTLHPWRDIPLDDPKTLQYFAKGLTATVFQFNTAAFIDMLKASTIETFNDLVSINTLARPGTVDAGTDKDWIKRRNGQADITSPHPDLEPILKDSYGIILYQEQVMASLRILANFTDEEADDIRRAIGKKDTKAIDSYGKEFVDRMTAKYGDEKKSAEIWNLIEAFGRYSFNLSHSLAYSMVSYVCMYLKVHFQVEWWCAVLRNETEDDKRRYYYKYIKNLMAPYDINANSLDYSIKYVQKTNAEGKKIKVGSIVPPLSSIKFVGKEICNQLSKGPFTSFDHFYTKVDRIALKKHVVINMIIGGLFSELHPDKTESELIEHFYKNHLGAKIKKNGQPNLIMKEWEEDFKMVTPDDLKKRKMEILPHNDISLNGLVMGVASKDIMPFSTVMKMNDKDRVDVVGLVLNTRAIKTKAGKDMFFAEISNEGENISLTVFPECAIMYRGVIRKGKIVRIKGKVSRYNNKFGIDVDKAEELGGKNE